MSAEDELLGEQFLDDYISGKIPRYKNRLRLEDDDWEQVRVGSALRDICGAMISSIDIRGRR